MSETAFGEGDRVEHDFTGQGTVEKVENGFVFVRWDEPCWGVGQYAQEHGVAEMTLRKVTSSSG